MKNKLIPDSPSVGIVIGTKAALPHIHLQLEARKRFYPDVPCLVHDDCSDKLKELNLLCSDYGADFSFNSEPLGHMLGDMSVFWHGLLWAQNKGLDLLLKLSRRFIPTEDFRPSLIALAVESQAATYSNECEGNRFGFRTEVMGMHTETWLSLHQIADWQRRAKDKDIWLPESFFHAWAVNVHPPCEACIEYEKSHPPKHGGYVAWPWMGNSRRAKHPGWIWHETHRLRDYSQLAYEWGIKYEPRQFTV